jgi:hypothetical protein
VEVAGSNPAPPILSRNGTTGYGEWFGGINRGYKSVRFARLAVVWENASMRPFVEIRHIQSKDVEAGDIIRCMDTAVVKPAVQTAITHYADGWLKVISMTPAQNHHVEIKATKGDVEVIFDRREWAAVEILVRHEVVS